MICKWCGGDAKEGTTCPKSIPCLTCGAEQGKSCTRPSGHRAHRLHTLRINMAEAMDRLDESKVLQHSVVTQQVLDVAQ